jgi:uncharacterized damage-inducible protein DinB
MTITAIKSILIRDIDLLYKEIEQYPETDMLWKILPGTSNSAGNLALHLCGNLHHFIGSVIGKSDYVRNRQEEFSKKDVDKIELLHMIQVCKTEVERILSILNDDILLQEFPVEISGVMSRTDFVLIHIISHLDYHRGQINYHRRFFTTVPAEL